MFKCKGKFFYLFVLLCLMLFLTAVTSGCGGGGGGSDNSSDTPIENEKNSPVEEEKEEEENPVDPVLKSEFTITFDSDGGTYVEKQTVKSGDIPVEPDEPEKEGNIFAGWFAPDETVFEFDLPVSEDITLTAKWVEEISATDEEIEMIEEAKIGGEISIPLSADENSPIKSLDISYELDSAGVVDVTEITSGPVMNITGLIGNPVNIDIIGDAEVTSAEITFSVDTSKTDINDLGIVWYNASDDFVVPISSDIVDNTIRATVNHFSMYAVVNLSQLLKVLNASIPDSNRNVVMFASRNNTERTKEVMSNFIDSLNDSDYLTVIMYGYFFNDDFWVILTTHPNESDPYYPYTYYYEQPQKGDIYRKMLVQNGHDNRQEIKDWINSMLILFKLSELLIEWDETYSVYPWSENQEMIEAALNYAINVHKEENCKQTIIFFPSSWNFESIEENYKLREIAQKIKEDDSLHFISVAANQFPERTLKGRLPVPRIDGLIEFTEQSDGTLIECNEKYVTNIKASFDKELDDVVVISEDKDEGIGDGLEDSLELKGMKDQYGKVWSTDPTMRDTDLDGIIDSEEMGRKVTGLYGTYSFYSRVSNPKKVTYRSPKAYLEISDSMLAENDVDKNRVELTVSINDWRYVEDDKSETFYEPAKNLKVEILDASPDYKIIEQPKLLISKLGTQIINSKTDAKRYQYKAVLEYSTKKPPELSYITWRVTADNIDKPVEKLQYVDFNQIAVKSGLFKAAETALAKVAHQFVGELFGSMEEKASTAETKLQAVKKLIMTTYSNVPDKIYEAFALAIVDVMADSKVDAYETNMVKLTNQIAANIHASVLKDKTADIVIDEEVYHVEMSITAQNGLLVGWANVQPPKGSTITLTFTNYGTADGIKALSEYCALLAQLNTEVWIDFMECFDTGIFSDINKELKEEYSGGALDFCEKVIKAFCENPSAESLLKTFGDEAQGKFKGKFLNPTVEQFKKYIKEMVPFGADFVKNVGSLKKTIDKFEDYRTRFNEYSVINKRKDDSQKKMQKSFEEFKSLYNGLGEIDIFKGFIPVSKWPDFF